MQESSRPFSSPRYSFRFVAIAALFVTCLLIANIVAVKLIQLPGGIIAPAGVVIFPLSYLFGDVLTEVYGYACRAPGHLARLLLQFGRGYRHRGCRRAATRAILAGTGGVRDHSRLHAVSADRLVLRLSCRRVPQLVRARDA